MLNQALAWLVARENGNGLPPFFEPRVTTPGGPLTYVSQVGGPVLRAGRGAALQLALGLFRGRETATRDATVEVGILTCQGCWRACRKLPLSG